MSEIAKHWIDGEWVGSGTVPESVPLLAAGITTFTEEFGMTGSRILVQREVADQVRTRLAGARRHRARAL